MTSICAIVRQVAQHRQIFRAGDARLVVHHAKRSDRASVRRSHGVADKKPDKGRTRDGGMVGKTRVRLGVRNDELFVFENRVLAKAAGRVQASQLGSVAGFEKEALFIHQDEESPGHVQDSRGQARERSKRSSGGVSSRLRARKASRRWASFAGSGAADILFILYTKLGK